MDLLHLLSDEIFLVSAALLCVAAIIVLGMSKRQRETVWNRLKLQRSRDSAAETPPRSLSPEKREKTRAEALEGHPDYAATPPDLVNAFPPSRREALVTLAETASKSNRKILIGTEPTKDFLRDASLPITRSYDLENESPKYTPTGFSTAEIKAMGDFPAYDILSGVPLPQAYKGFDPVKALPRPYRPFRWAYHQTMC